MTLPAAMGPDRTAALGGTPPEPVPPAADPPPAGPPTAGTPGWRRGLGRVARSGPGRAGVGATRKVLRRLLADELAPSTTLVHEVTELHERIGDLADAGLDVQMLVRQVESNKVNLELLKAEVRGLERTLHELGMQLAPATGLAGVGDRFGELREQVNAVSRRLRQLDPATGAATLREPASPEAGDDALVPVASGRVASTMDELFDYVAFERRFRGTPEEILATQVERYADLLAGHAPVVDLGCGRGELAQALDGRGVEVVGVEPDAGMAAEARDRGVTVVQADAAGYLRSCEDDSLGAVFSAHVAEHVPFEVLLEMIHLSLRKLRPGGVFVAETPNPAALIVPSNSFILDPTHLRPIHPSLFAFVCETAGFRDVRLTFHAPASGYHLPRGGGVPDAAGAGVRQLAEVVDQHAERLNDVLFGHQEYVVVATKA